MKKLLVMLVALFPVLAQAHEEHGHSVMENISHVFSSPEHTWPLTLGIVLVMVVGVITICKK